MHHQSTVYIASVAHTRGNALNQGFCKRICAIDYKQANHQPFRWQLNLTTHPSESSIELTRLEPQDIQTIPGLIMLVPSEIELKYYWSRALHDEETGSVLWIASTAFLLVHDWGNGPHALIIDLFRSIDDPDDLEDAVLEGPRVTMSNGRILIAFDVMHCFLLDYARCRCPDGVSLRLLPEGGPHVLNQQPDEMNSTWCLTPDDPNDAANAVSYFLRGKEKTRGRKISTT